jgi:hypothetical protein
MPQGYQIALPTLSSPAFTVPRWMRIGLCYLLFLVVFESLIKSPMPVLIYLLFIGYPLLFFYLAFFFLYFTDRFLAKGASFTALEWWIMGMLLFVFLQGGLVTNVYFGQPIYLGITAEKSWLAILVAFVWWYLLKVKFLDITIIKDALLFMAWFHLPIFFTLIVTLNPNHYQNSLFVYCNSAKGGCQFKFDIFPFEFATVYYFIRFVRSNKWWFGLFVAIFFGYIFFINQKRGTSVALIGAMGLYYLLNLSWNKIIFYAVSVILLIFTAVLLLYVVRPDILDRMATQYKDVILVLEGQQSEEASADARIRETHIAIKYFNENKLSIIFGNGKINNNWKQGPTGEFGHFYPSDIGMLGVVFQFGLLGLCLGLIEYVIVFFNHRRIKKYKYHPFYQAVIYYIVFFVVRGIPSGGSFFDPGMQIAATFAVFVSFFAYMESHPEKNYKTF